MGDRHDGGLLHCGMTDQRVFQVHRTDPFSAGLDEVLGAVGDLHVAFGIDGDHVAGSQPAVRRPAVALFGKVVITGGNAWAADFQLAGSLVVPGNFAVVANGADIGKWGRQSLAGADLKFAVIGAVLQVGLQSSYGDDRGRFGHAPRLDYAYAELLEAPEQAFRRRRSRDDDAQTGRELPALGLSFQSIH